MTANSLEDLMKRADGLSVDEQLRLAAYLVDRARKSQTAGHAGRKWRELCGLAPDLLAGEDAQEWVSRTRREADERRTATRRRE